MAIKYTNANRHGATSSTSSSSRTPDPRLKAREGSRDYSNQDGPRGPGGGDHGTTIDYGPHKGGFSFAGLTSPRWDDRNPAFDYTPEKLAAEAAARQPYIQSRNDALRQNPEFVKALQSGDLKGVFRIMQQMHGENLKQKFLDQGGTSGTWENRFDPNNNWPVPRSELGVESHGPGRPDFPGGGAPAGRALGMGGASTGAAEAAPGGAADVLAALSRVASMPPGAPTAARGDIGGFARAASAVRPMIAMGRR